MVDKKNENIVHVTQQKWANVVLNIGKAYKKKASLDNLISELLY